NNRSRPSSSRAACATSRWPRCTGSNEPPNRPSFMGGGSRVGGRVSSVKRRLPSTAAADAIESFVGHLGVDFGFGSLFAGAGVFTGAVQIGLAGKFLDEREGQRKEGD